MQHLDLRQRLVEVRDDVLHVLDAHREADEVLGEVRGLKLLCLFCFTGSWGRKGS